MGKLMSSPTHSLAPRYLFHRRCPATKQFITSFLLSPVTKASQNRLHVLAISHVWLATKNCAVKCPDIFGQAQDFTSSAYNIMIHLCSVVSLRVLPDLYCHKDGHGKSLTASMVSHMPEYIPLNVQSANVLYGTA
ncbi:hypothetical protein ElyMa_003938000 [Elysia marginata]|uniref:Uncharacterized protein n=1 Tax=Elysia marginata TaxID=1093978 RepID=A0AAV4FSS5_9GAST|nr:hypothetical protein ElyMa_003938000 [Elysia marginata]